MAVQVKRREKIDKTESVSTIRDFLGAILLGDYPKGIVVSTADKFTKPAQKSSSSPFLKAWH
ncbi:MAG: restriction endonuclease [Ignavibacteria bacterium]|nr:restriction endonuclease [Ignavibacteria bacterium]